MTTFHLLYGAFDKPRTIAEIENNLPETAALLNAFKCPSCGSGTKWAYFSFHDEMRCGLCEFRITGRLIKALLYMKKWEKLEDFMPTEF